MLIVVLALSVLFGAIFARGVGVFVVFVWGVWLLLLFVCLFLLWWLPGLLLMWVGVSDGSCCVLFPGGVSPGAF